MKEITKYSTNSGKTRYKFTVYAGKDGTTGKSIIIRKQGFKTLKQAKQALLNVQQAILNGDYLPISEKRLTYKELFIEWWAVYEKSVKQSTAFSCKIIFNKSILPYFGSKYIDKITLVDCQRWANKLANDSPASFKETKARASRVLDYAIKLGMLTRNPFKLITMPKTQKKKEKQENFYTKEELFRFLQQAKKSSFQKYAMFRLLAFSGMRKGELLALNWADIDFKAGTVSINKTLSRDASGKTCINDTPKTASSTRIVTLDSETMAVLKEWRRRQLSNVIYLGQSKDNLVFYNSFTGVHFSLVTLNDWASSIAKQAGIKSITPHGFRHTHASLCFAAGLSMQDVKERLGHSSITMTMDIYTHVTQKQSKAGAEKLARFAGF